jgi:Arc/MetJ family transcription regulator
MRTTLTLDDDLAQRVADLARESHRPFKAVVNEALRRGLGDLHPGEAEFRVDPHAGHMQPGIDDRRLNELAWEIDEERVRGLRSTDDR